MMFKRHVLKKISAYLDSQLSEKENFDVEKHISECNACKQELIRLKLVSDKLKEVKVPDLHEDFDSSVRDEILRRGLEGGRVEMDKKPLRILIPSGVIAGILVMLVVGVNMQKFVKRTVHGETRGANNTIDELSYDKKHYRDEDMSSSINNYFGLSKETDAAFFDRNNYAVAYRVDNGALRSKLNRRVSRDEEGAAIFGKNHRDYLEYESQGIYSASGAVTSREILEPQGSVIVIQPVLPATGEEDMIIRTGYINLEVESGKDTHSKASQICQELGGYISNSNFYKDKEGRETGTITMRIPRAVFDTALDKLSALGKIEGMNTNSRDASQEYANLKAQLDAKKVVYDKMLDALNRRKVSIPEAIHLESQLTPIIYEIEQLKNRIEYINNQVAFTTITLNFHEPKVSTKALKESKKIIKETAISATINAVKFLAAAIPIVIVIGFWGVIIVVAVLVIKHWILRIFKRD